MTLNREKFATLVISGALVLSLSGCAPEATVDNDGMMKEATSEVINSAVNEIEKIDFTVDKSSLSQEEIDAIAIDYFTSLSEEASSLFNDIKENGLESANELKEKAKEIIVKAKDFKDNKFDINGIYYSDLSANGKKVVDGLIGGLKTTVAMIAPNLGDDIKGFIGEDVYEKAKDAKDSLKELGGSAIDWASESLDEKIESFRR